MFPLDRSHDPGMFIPLRCEALCKEGGRAQQEGTGAMSVDPMKSRRVMPASVEECDSSLMA
jgi:hypothetical protein